MNETLNTNFESYSHNAFVWASEIDIDLSAPNINVSGMFYSGHIPFSSF